MAGRTIREILARTEEFFGGRGVDNPRLSAQVLVAFGLGVDRMRLFLDLDRPLRESELELLRPLVARRGKGEPVALIVGEKEFFCRAFSLCGETLVPRPETELLVEIVMERFGADAAFCFADLGTGSGILAVTLAAQFPQASGAAWDVSSGALEAARGNAARHGVDGRIEFVRGDYCGVGERAGAFDVIVSNPPYVSEAEYACLSREVRDFEPKGALVPGESGLESYRAIAPAAFAALKPGGLVAVEIGCTQAGPVTDILSASGFAEIAVRKDLAGLDRAVVAVRPS